MKIYVLPLLVLCGCLAHAQPDSLWQRDGRSLLTNFNNMYTTNTTAYGRCGAPYTRYVRIRAVFGIRAWTPMVFGTGFSRFGEKMSFWMPTWPQSTAKEFTDLKHLKLNYSRFSANLSVLER